MPQQIAHITVLVKDYDEAITFYTQKLQFTLVEDTQLSDTKRWVLVSPGASAGCSLLLAKASGEEQQQRIGNQTGGRVFLFLYTNEFESYFKHLTDYDVEIVAEPVAKPWGRVAVFADLYGNHWDLIERTSA